MNQRERRLRGEKGSGQEGIWKLAGLVGITGLALSLLAEYHYHRLPQLPSIQPLREPVPELSIIIPARNEAHNLPRLLESLRELRYPGTLEIIVVDDGSEDETAAIAQCYGVRLLSLSGPPAGWSGKAYACQRGAEAAEGEWLLFTDADTCHSVEGPAQAMAYAREQQLDGLSLFLHQESKGLTDRLALLVAHAGLFVGLHKPAGMLNGQYILLSREVYFESGGFATVPREATEDLALGHSLHRQQFRVPLLRGEQAATVHMYHNVRHLWQGLSRFGVSSLRWLGPASLITALHTILVAAPLSLLVTALLRRRPLLPALGGWLLVTLGLLPWANRFGGPQWAVLAPLGALQVEIAAIWGLLRRLSGRGILWKERRL